MLRNNKTPRPPVTPPNQIKHPPPSVSHASPHRHTATRLIAPDGIGRSLRYIRSNSASMASFRNMPPVYRQVAPMNRNGSLSGLPAPPSHQPARQFDQTVGKFETRPKTSKVRSDGCIGLVLSWRQILA